MPTTRVVGGNNVTVIINNNSPAVGNLPLFSQDFVPVPGLGFDMVHFAALHGTAAVGGQTFPGGMVSSGGSFFQSGFFLPAAPTIVIQMPPIVIQQPVIQLAPPEPVEAPAPAKAVPAEEPPAKPVRDAAEYVFVKRDGGLLFAVAFLWERDHLQYITREGQRRSIALGTLDLEATQRFNEERGLTFRLPA